MVMIHDTSILPLQRESQIQATSPTRHPGLQILSYTQTTQTQNIQPGSTIITLQSNTKSNYTTFGILSTHPLQTIPKNPQSFSLTSTNPNNTQQFSTQNT